jgi:hypothetical protein
VPIDACLAFGPLTLSSQDRYFREPYARAAVVGERDSGHEFLPYLSVKPHKIVRSWTSWMQTQTIIYDSEYYILEAQHGQKWAAEDIEIDQKLAALRKKYDTPSNINSLQ